LGTREEHLPEIYLHVLQVFKEEGWHDTFEATLGGPSNNVKHCSSVPPDVHDYFLQELDRTVDRKKSKQKERLLREEVVTEGNVIHDIDFDDDEFHRAFHASREDEQFARASREGGGTI
jgi:hypothetical protein